MAACGVDGGVQSDGVGCWIADGNAAWNRVRAQDVPCRGQRFDCKTGVRHLSPLIRAVFHVKHTAKYVCLNALILAVVKSPARFVVPVRLGHERTSPHRSAVPRQRPRH
ncbi:protein of unknown function [Thauera humireducens]|nr:protein of unknown function [Thauera humireducens]